MILRILLLLACAGQAFGQGVEVTPFIGFGGGGAVSLEDEDTSLDPAVVGGVFVSFDYGARRKFDIVYARQQTVAERVEPFEPLISADVTIDYLHIGGRYQLIPRGRFLPYVAGTLGGTRVNIRGADGLGFSFAFGAGADYRLTSRVVLRFDGRFFTTAGAGQTEVACNDQGDCSGFSSTSAFTQVVGTAGVVFRFR
jgi:opacity protein-like surface antigen